MPVGHGWECDGRGDGAWLLLPPPVAWRVCRLGAGVVWRPVAGVVWRPVAGVVWRPVAGVVWRPVVGCAGEVAGRVRLAVEDALGAATVDELVDRPLLGAADDGDALRPAVDDDGAPLPLDRCPDGTTAPSDGSPGDEPPDRFDRGGTPGRACALGSRTLLARGAPFASAIASPFGNLTGELSPGRGTPATRLTTTAPRTRAAKTATRRRPSRVHRSRRRESSTKIGAHTSA